MAELSFCMQDFYARKFALCERVTVSLCAHKFDFGNSQQYVLIVEWCGDGISGKYGLIRMVRQ